MIRKRYMFSKLEREKERARERERERERTNLIQSMIFFLCLKSKEELRVAPSVSI